MKPKILQLCSLMPPVQAVLDAGYAALAWPADAGAREALLAAEGEGIRAVVTSGGLGVTEALMERLPQARLVAINGVGYDRVDIPAMQARNIRVSNTPDVLTDDVADLAIALMLNVMRRLPEVERHVRDGAWPGGDPPLARRASGLAYGIVGYGRIGDAIARRLAGFGGRIAYTSRRRKEVAHDFHAELVSLARASDVLFVAASASPATAGMVDRAVLDALGPDGVLVNIARGSLIDEPALVEALVEKRIWGAGLDVFAGEPEVPHALLGLPNVALAPHVGSATHETREAMGRLMVANLDAFFAGEALPSEVL